jgi:AraC-like DNA-binding protein
LAGERPITGRPFVYVGARVDLAHRRLLAATRTGDVEYAVAEGVGELLRATDEHRHRPSLRGARADRSVVAEARDAIIGGDPAAESLASLAVSLHVSPGLLSRYFSRVLGMSVTRYRNSVRVGHVLDRLADGEESLATLSSDLGFADQAHLCRTVRTHLGYTPSAVRRILDPNRRPGR